VFFQRILAFVIFGIVPALIIISIFKSSLKQYGLIFQTGFSSFLLVIIFGGLVILINRVHAKSNANLEIYPQIRANKWNFSLLVLSTFSWMMYLFAYEFMFRGFLLFSCINQSGIIAAILINVILYALAHLSKGKSEFFGAIPMGIILCAISIYYKSFLPAFWIHCFLAISNEWYSIKYNPEITIIKKWQS
jgi:membrane protease YdiL (CAAX protease family)